MIWISNTTKEVLEKIEVTGYTCYIVGGYVRDALQGSISDDIDIATNAPLRVLKEVFSAHTLTLNESYGTLSFSIKKQRFEITRFREEYGYFDGRHPQGINFVDSIEKDVVRRDFTINSLYYHPVRGLIDVVGAQSDLDKRILRTVGDPTIRFDEDKLRALRFFRFVSCGGYTEDPLTKQAAKQALSKTEHYTISWTKEEFFKLIMGKYFLQTVLDNPECMYFVVSELKQAKNFDQDNPYHKYNLYEHTVRVMHQLETFELRLAALFHDLGKLSTRVFEDGRARYPNHATASAQLAQTYMDQWNINRTLKKRILAIIKYHDVDLGDSMESLAGFVYDYGYDLIALLVRFKKADNTEKSHKAFYQLGRCEKYYQQMVDLKERGLSSRKGLQLTGKDLEWLGVDVQMRESILKDIYIKVASRVYENKHDTLIRLIGAQYGIY